MMQSDKVKAAREALSHMLAYRHAVRADATRPETQEGWERACAHAYSVLKRLEG